jgi:hypothetical protein
LVEQLIRNQQVSGSIPLVGSIDSDTYSPSERMGCKCHRSVTSFPEHHLPAFTTSDEGPKTRHLPDFIRYEIVLDCRIVTGKGKAGQHSSSAHSDGYRRVSRYGAWGLQSGYPQGAGPSTVMACAEGEMTESVFDVVLQSTGGFEVMYWDWEQSPPKDDFSLGPDFWLGKLPYHVKGETVFDACGPAGLNFHLSRLYGYRDAFCRRVYPTGYGSEHLTWDHDGVLIHPLISTEFG